MNKLGETNEEGMSLRKKWSILASHASLPWTVFIGCMFAVWPIYSWKELVANLRNNYQAKSERILNPYSNTFYECWDWMITQYLCHDIVEIVERWSRTLHVSFPESSLEDGEINDWYAQFLKAEVETFLNKYPDNFQAELEKSWWLKDYDPNNPESITQTAKTSELELVLLWKKLERYIPLLKNQIKARSKQEYLSEEERRKFLDDLSTIWYTWWFDLKSITDFFLFTNPKFESKENQLLRWKLFSKYFWEVKLNLSWEKIVGRYEWSSINGYLYLLVLSLIATLLYTWLILPLSWMKKLKKEFREIESWMIQNWVTSVEQLKTVNNYRKLLSLQSYSDSVKMFDKLCLVPNWYIIRKKWLNGLVFLKKNGAIQWLLLNKEWKYDLCWDPISNNRVLSSILEEYWFTFENIEIVDWGNILADPT